MKKPCLLAVGLTLLPAVPTSRRTFNLAAGTHTFTALASLAGQSCRAAATRLRGAAGNARVVRFRV